MIVNCGRGLRRGRGAVIDTAALVIQWAAAAGGAHRSRSAAGGRAGPPRVPPPRAAGDTPSDHRFIQCLSRTDHEPFTRSHTYSIKKIYTNVLLKYVYINVPKIDTKMTFTFLCIIYYILDRGIYDNETITSSYVGRYLLINFKLTSPSYLGTYDRHV